MNPITWIVASLMNKVQTELVLLSFLPTLVIKGYVILASGQGLDLFYFAFYQSQTHISHCCIDIIHTTRISKVNSPE